MDRIDLWKNANTLEKRAEAEEFLRHEIYGFVDDLHPVWDRIDEVKEWRLWGLLHNVLESLADFYESRGFTTFKH